MAQIKVDWVPLAHGLYVLIPPLDAPKDPKVQPWTRHAQPFHSMPSL